MAVYEYFGWRSSRKIDRCFIGGHVETLTYRIDKLIMCSSTVSFLIRPLLQRTNLKRRIHPTKTWDFLFSTNFRISIDFHYTSHFGPYLWLFFPVPSNENVGIELIDCTIELLFTLSPKSWPFRIIVHPILKRFRVIFLKWCSDSQT